MNSKQYDWLLGNQKEVFSGKKEKVTIIQAAALAALSIPQPITTASDPITGSKSSQSMVVPCAIPKKGLCL